MPKKYDDLREACIEEAMTIIETSGIEGLSMREVSRRLGVSHQAPYKHFPSRDHILAEIVRRSFEEFAAHLDARPRSDNPHDDLRAMGEVYLRYALEHPLHYRLMFGTPLPDAETHPAMMENAQHAFSILRDALSKIGLPSEPSLDAMYVWSTMHGLASIMQMPMAHSLDVPEHLMVQMAEHVLMRIGSGLGDAANRD